MDPFESILYMIWRGIAVGVLISAPMGPVGMLCIQRTIDKGRHAGFYTGIGAAISDLFYCLLTGFGLSFIEDFIESNQNVIQLIGSIVLIGFSIYLFRKDPSANMKRPVPQNVSIKKNILGGFLFTFSNPLIIFLIIGLFARFNFTGPDINSYIYAVGYLFIFAGALGWWYGVTYAIEKVRGHFNVRSMKILNIIIGIVILCFACVGIVSSIVGLTSAPAKATDISPLTRYISPDTSIDGLHINRSSDSIAQIPIPLLPRESGRSFQLDFKLRSSPGSLSRRHTYRNDDGSSVTSYIPPWGILLFSSGKDSIFIENAIDEYLPNDFSSQMALQATASLSGGLKYKSDFISEGINTSGGWNHFRLIAEQGKEIILQGGNRKLHRIFNFDAPADLPDSLAITLRPGAEIELKEIKFRLLPNPSNYPGSLDAEDISMRLIHSNDPTEGKWRLLDYSLDNNMAGLGGDYTVAIIAMPDASYEIVYIDGAESGASLWSPGMLKGVMIPTGIEGVFNAEWIDAFGTPLPIKGKAQRDANEILTLQFPHLSATLRFERLPRP